LSSDSPLSPDPIAAGAVLPLDLGDGLRLEETTEADAGEAFAVVTDERERLREWLPWVDGTTELSIEREFLRGVERANAVGAGLSATIRCDGDFCGFAGLRIKETRHTAEIGYWLSCRFEGRGLMLRSVAAMFEAGFETLGMRRLELLAATDNVRSRAIAERLGMTFEGVRREAEQLASGFVDLAMYAVLARDWPGAEAALARASTNGA
jgi:ribosomal-protein-serine acetyltransferase